MAGTADTVLPYRIAPATPDSSAKDPVFPPEVMKHVAFWLRVFMEEWHGEVPLKIHSWELGRDGAPQWHPDFARWIEREDEAEERRRNREHRQTDARIRTTRAFRKLRKTAPREFDVLYCLVVHRMRLNEIAESMTARAIRLGKPERYTPTSVLILTVSAVEKVAGWW